ncbi:MAG: YbaK/EbsC family protein [Thermoanaerobacteraceae bacterium]|nr:YbaK/EbsC family protein [Thermoanaerobacteraceae bacterium]
MSVDDVKKYFHDNNLPYEVIEMSVGTETVELAARAIGVEPGRIAKTLAFKLKDRYILMVAKGDARISNRKYKDFFGEKARMLNAEEVLEVTGHPVGGVCPFGLKTPVDIYLDISLKQYDMVYPAAGSKNSMIKISPDELQKVTGGIWVDVCE